MISLSKTLDTSWEKARYTLMEDLESIEDVFNTKWAGSFTRDGNLKPAAIAGDSSVSPRYISDNGVAGSLQWDQVDLGAGVKGTLSVGHGGTGATSFQAGSIPFSDGSVLTEDNADL